MANAAARTKKSLTDNLTSPPANFSLRSFRIAINGSMSKDIET